MAVAAPAQQSTLLQPAPLLLPTPPFPVRMPVLSKKSQHHNKVT